MTVHTYLDHGVTILNARLQTPHARPPVTPGTMRHPFITISREACAGATALGQQLVPLLNEQLGEDGRSWIFLDKDLITHALTKHQLPERLVDYLPEDRISEIKSLIGELVGLHPSIWELEHKVSEAILQLAQLGCVILTGRASHLITRSLPDGFHLRLVASLPSRIKRMMELKNCDAEAARHALLSTDQARHRYAQTNFQHDIADPHDYDLVINTDLIPPACAANLVVCALRDRIRAASPAPSG
jgi:cytidylate kinase